jgi:hypothetical protein
MSSMNSRLRRLEERAGCPECRHKPEGIRVVYDEGQPIPEPERCPRCHRPLEVVIKVVYDDEEGEGV